MGRVFKQTGPNRPIPDRSRAIPMKRQQRAPPQQRGPLVSAVSADARSVAADIATKFKRNIGLTRAPRKSDQLLQPNPVFEASASPVPIVAVVQTPRPRSLRSRVVKPVRKRVPEIVEIDDEEPCTFSEIEVKPEPEVITLEEAELEVIHVETARSAGGSEGADYDEPDLILLDDSDDGEQVVNGGSVRAVGEAKKEATNVVFLDLDKEEEILEAESAQAKAKPPCPVKAPAKPSTLQEKPPTHQVTPPDPATNSNIELAPNNRMKAPPPKPFITNYFKSNSAQEPTTWRNQMPRFPPLRIDPTVVFQRGRPGNYAVRYRRSCQMPTTKFRVNLVEQFRYAGCGLTMADCTDSLTYHSLENYSVPLRNWLNFQPCNGDPQLNPPVRVCSYNVLCQPTIEKTKYLYRHLDGRNTYLRWEYRWSLMKRELFQLQADIFCLQEVFYLHYQTEFLLLFERMGYVGRYERKNGGSMDVHDGCAIFYRRDVFEEIHYRPVRMYANENCALDKPNIGQVIRLRHLTTGRELCVANTHLIFNTKSGHRKFAQLALLLAHLKAVCEMRNPRYHTQARVEYILCGDFNIEPFSDIYRFVIEKQLNLDFCRLKEMSGQGERDNSMGVTIDLPREVGLKTNCTFAAPGERYSVLDRTWTHDLNFASSYFHLKTDHQHDLSTFHSRQGLNPDIIFYSVNQTYVNEEDSTLQVQEGGLRLLRRLELPDISEATTIIGPWPNKHTPSDHVPLLVEFAFV